MLLTPGPNILGEFLFAKLRQKCSDYYEPKDVIGNKVLREIRENSRVVVFPPSSLTNLVLYTESASRLLQ